MTSCTTAPPCPPHEASTPRPGAGSRSESLPCDGTRAVEACAPAQACAHPPPCSDCRTACGAPRSARPARPSRGEQQPQAAPGDPPPHRSDPRCPRTPASPRARTRSDAHTPAGAAAPGHVPAAPAPSSPCRATTAKDAALCGPERSSQPPASTTRAPSSRTRPQRTIRSASRTPRSRSARGARCPRCSGGCGARTSGRISVSRSTGTDTPSTGSMPSSSHIGSTAWSKWTRSRRPCEAMSTTEPIGAPSGGSKPISAFSSRTRSQAAAADFTYRWSALETPRERRPQMWG